MNRLERLLSEMDSYFDIRLEFNHKKVDDIIEKTIRNNKVGYVCSVNANIIATSERDPSYKKIVNNALVNICDGGPVALVLSMIHFKTFKPYVGADLFIDYIKNRHGYKYFFLGSDAETLNGLRNYLTNFNPHLNEYSFLPLPFHRDPIDFDYAGIASILNESKPDIIWVSLGAPKQEQFMYYLRPYLAKGIMFGFGAIFKFYSGDPKFRRAPRVFRSLKLEWLYRVFLQEPRRLVGRFGNDLMTMTKLIFREVFRANL